MSKDNNMALPEGKTCNHCVHVRRCTLLGYTPSPDAVRCSFGPSRFRMNWRPMEEDNRRLAGLVEELEEKGQTLCHHLGTAIMAFDFIANNLPECDGSCAPQDSCVTERCLRCYAEEHARAIAYSKKTNQIERTVVMGGQQTGKTASRTEELEAMLVRARNILAWYQRSYDADLAHDGEPRRIIPEIDNLLKPAPGGEDG